MAITAIAVDWSGSPRIVRIVTTDTLATITTSGYLTTQVDELNDLQHGDFQWEINDEVLITYADGQGFFTRNATTNSFTAQPASAGTLTNTLTNGSIFVGNASNIATGVALTGPIAITNAGVTSIVNGTVVLADLATGIAPAGVIKFMGQATTTGGSAAQAITVTGAVAATDRAFVQIVDNGTNNVTALQAVVTTNTLTITFSADPGADCIVNYQLIRAAS